MSSIAGSRAAAGGESAGARVKAYFFSDSRRSIQTVLGLIWLLVGALQFQSFMYGNGFIQLLQGLTGGQPGWVASSVNQGAATMQSHQAIFNTGAALIQLAIGFGILYKRTTKPAILVSFAWVLAVWWFGEAFGMMFMATTPMGGIPMASALTGAPGAVLLYALIGAIVWPNDRPGGLLGVRGARIAWAALWLLMAWLWLVEAGGANGIHNDTLGGLACPRNPWSFGGGVSHPSFATHACILTANDMRLCMMKLNIFETANPSVS